MTVFEPHVEVLVEQPKRLSPPDLSPEGILTRFPGLAEVDAVCFTGSTAAGWSNPYSDIDMFAFTDVPVELPVDETMETWEASAPGGLRWRTWMGRYGDARVDLKLWPTDALDQVLAPYREQPEPEFCESVHKVKDFVYRMSVAEALTGAPFFEAARASIASSSYGRALARTLKIDTENRLMDVFGQLEAGDGASARLSAMTAATWITDCCLVMTGDLCRSEKWLMRRLAAHPECGVGVEEYRETVLGGLLPGETDSRCAARLAGWVREKMATVEPAVLG